MDRIKFKFFLTYLFVTFLVVGACSASGEVDKSLERWVGKYPIVGPQNIIKNPLIASQAKALTGPDLYTRLAELDKKPYYLLLPIEFQKGYYILHYPPNGHFNPEDDRLFFFINSGTLKVHFARIFEGKLIWRHGESAPIPSELEKYATKYAFE